MTIGRIGFPVSSLAFTPSGWPMRLSSCRVPARIHIQRATSLNLSLLSRVPTLAPPSRTIKDTEQLPPLRFLSLRRISDDGQPHTPNGYQPLSSGAFPAFPTPSRLSSGHHLPAMFQTGPAHGISPSGLFRLRLQPAFQSVVPSCG
jgi:hypothetical protein